MYKWKKYFKLSAGSIITLLLLSCHPAGIRGQTAVQETLLMEQIRADVVAKAQKAVVHIKVEKTVQNSNEQKEINNPLELFNEEFLRRFFPDFQIPEPQRSPQRKHRLESLGSGAIINTNGHILTNHHVVDEADKILVRLTDGRKFEAELVGTDPLADIAVIRIRGNNLPVLPMGNSDAIRVSESVIAIGNPFGLSYTVTMGIVSAKGRSNIGIVAYEDFIQTDAAINPGNSGGPLVNLKGEIIGINTAIFSKSGGYQGIGFAVPINMAHKIMNELIAHGKVIRSWLGVGLQDLSEDLAESFGVKNGQGALITSVEPKAPADKAGILPGDVILYFNGKVIVDGSQLRNEVATAAPGTQAKVELMRRGQLKKLTVLMKERKETAISSQQAPPSHFMGIYLQDLTPKLAIQLGIPRSTGVLIIAVEPDSPAENSGLNAGLLILEINFNPIKNEEEFFSALKTANPSKGILMRVLSPEGALYLLLRE
ncbi:MAG: DegQ family serine endoprotease [SAR324 cluster bacterium]|nr:DegQ family serine endoprotease [SAR324 cluster bacterium]